MELNRQDCIRIRQSLDLKPRPAELKIHFFKDALLWGAIFFLWNVSDSPLAHLAAAPLLAILMFRGFSLMHDAVHGAVSSDRNLNRAIGIWGGALSFLPFEQWRLGHLEHHFWSGNLERDPVMGLLRAFPKFPAPLRLALRAGWKLWLPVISIAQHAVFWNLSLREGLNRKTPLASILSLASPLLVWSGLVSLTPAGFAPFVAFPAVLIYLLGTEIINLPHHLQLIQLVGDVRVPVWRQHETARTCLYPRWFARNIVLNFNFHSAHHMFPDSPWYHLERIHEAVAEKLEGELKTDHNWGWTLANRKRSFADVLSHEAEPDEQPQPQPQAAA